MNTAALRAATLPRLTFGAVQQLPPADVRPGVERLLQYQRTNVVQLRGRDRIRSETGLPQPAKDILLLHARALPEGELDSYIVIPEQAQAWADQLPEEMRDELRKAASDDGKKDGNEGCSTRNLSMDCAGNELEQLEEDLKKTFEKAWDDTVAEWGRLMGSLEDAQRCFNERTLSASGPVRLTTTPRIPLDFSRDSTGVGRRGSANKEVRGTMAIGLPVEVDAIVRFEASYIPCMPFAIRPESLGAEGSLGVGAVFDAHVIATQAFDEEFGVPGDGSVRVPLAVIPIELGNVSLAVIDAGFYLGGRLRIDGEGTLDSRLQVQSVQRTDFGFECSGHGCRLDVSAAPEPVTGVESVQLEGRIRLRPSIYSALHLGLNYDLLSARAGAEVYLESEIRGCGAAGAAQSTGGEYTAAANHALMADVDWGIEVRAEAFAGGKRLESDKWGRGQRHLLFEDLAYSTALVPTISGAAQATAGRPAAFAMTMPSCYPYADPLRYQVRWTGDAAAPEATPRATLARALPSRRTSSAPGAANTDCTIAAGQASCRGAPSGDTPLYLSWPAAGDYRLTVMPVEDAHGRRFEAASAEWAVNVSP